MALPITIYPHSVLREKTESLSLETIKAPETQELIDAMIATMYLSRGVGLAAPQVNKKLRLTVIDTEDGEGSRVFINPEISGRSRRADTQEEGCLSLPNVYGMVKRPKSLTINFFDRTGKKQTLQASGFLARVLQHEVDHLDGILFIDHTDKLTKGAELLAQWDAGKTPLLGIPYPYIYESK